MSLEVSVSKVIPTVNVKGSPDSITRVAEDAYGDAPHTSPVRRRQAFR